MLLPFSIPSICSFIYLFIYSFVRHLSGRVLTDPILALFARCVALLVLGSNPDREMDFMELSAYGDVRRGDDSGGGGCRIQ